MSDVAVLEWKTECWKCGSGTPVVWPKCGYLNSNIGDLLSEAGEHSVERVYSKRQGREVWGNVCEHCSAYQGNYYVEQEALELDPPLVECNVCGEMHEWYPDAGMGGAFGQGWIGCPEYRVVPVSDPRGGDDG